MKSNSNPQVVTRGCPTQFVVSLAVICLLTTPASPAHAVFDTSVSPPRFELRAKPGEVIRQSITVSNGSTSSIRYNVKTSDWTQDTSGGVQYLEGSPSTESCRPWVRIERREIEVSPGGSRTFRFEIHVPGEARSGECQFALLIAAEAGKMTQPGRQQIQLPIVGRMAVIVYVAIGNAKPDVRLAALGIKRINGKTTPVAEFVNQGNAHGRVFGSLEAIDSAGKRVELVAQQGSILPRGRRMLRLNPVDYSSGEARPPTFDLSPPIHARGTLQLFGGGEIKIDQVIR